MAVSLKLGHGTVVFAAIAEATRGPKIFDRIASASAQRNSVLDVPITRLGTGLFVERSGHPSAKRSVIKSHLPPTAPQRFNLKPVFGLKGQLTLAQITPSIRLIEDLPVYRF